VSLAHDATDPFGHSPDPEAYVPRQASEEALAALAAFLRVGATEIALRGPPGIGKTLLLRVIASRLEGHLRVVHVPYPVLPADEICAWILGLMGEEGGGDDERALVALAHRLRENGSGLAILIDDAGSMPLPTVRRISRIAAEARPAMRLVFALPDDERGDEVQGALGPGVETITFDEPMSLPETAAYVEARLARAHVPDRIREGFDVDLLQAIHEDSEGIPQLVNALAVEWLGRISTRVAEEARVGGSPLAPTTSGESRLGSALLGPSGAAVEDPWLDREGPQAPPREEAPAPAPPSAPPEAPPAASQAAPPPELSAAEPAEEVEPVVAPRRRRSRGPRFSPVAWRSAAVAAALFAVFALGLLTGRISGPLWRSEPPAAPSEEAAGTAREAGSPEAAPAPPAETRAPSPPVAAAPPPTPPVADVEAAEPGTPPAPASEPEGESAPSAVAATPPGEPAATREAASPAPPPVLAVREPEESAETPTQAEPAPDAEPTPVAAGEPSATAAPADAAGGAEERGGAEEGEASDTTASATEPVLVSVNATPWARIAIDERDVGVTPLADLRVEAGEHEFQATLPDGRVLVRRVTISSYNRRVVFP
jgi:hypothetical protein